MHTPILNNLRMTGRIIVEPGNYHFTGCASDGELLTLPGSVERPDQTEAYLTDFPTPDMW